jgi:peptide/nickel transport system permease protein
VFRSPALRFLLRRLLLAIPLLFVVSALSFALVSFIPGDAATEILGLSAPPSSYEKLRHSLGLNLPVYDQYWHWLKHAIRGDLGASLFTDQKVTRMVDARLPVTLSLIGCSLLVSTLIGVGLGMLSALRGGVLGRILDGASMLGYATPSFWIGAVLIVLFAVKLRWLPAIGYVPLAQSPALWLRSLTLPVIALALHAVAVIAKQTRAAMLDVLGSEYIRMLRASGISERSINFRHALRNAAPVVVTVLGVEFVILLGGTVFVESVFALPGLGSLAVATSIQHDLPLVEGIVVYFTVIVVLVNLVIDLLYMWLNPRIRVR